MRLRDRMLDDLKLAGYSPATMREYERCVRKLTEVVGKPPRRIDPEDVRRFLVGLADDGALSASTRKVYVCAFRFFFRTTLRRPEVVAHLPLPKVDTNSPDVLLGHRSIHTTMRYLHLSRQKLGQVRSPLDTATEAGWTDR